MESPLMQVQSYANGNSAPPQGQPQAAPMPAQPQVPVQDVINNQPETAMPQLSKSEFDLNKARLMLDAQIQKLSDSLNRRQNQTFDPKMLKVAGALLKPARTGNFFEALGNATDAYSDASEKELALDANNQKMQLELMQKRVELQRQMGGDSFMQGLAQNPLGQAPIGQAPIAGGVPPAGGAVPPPAGGAAPIQVADSGQGPVSDVPQTPTAAPSVQTLDDALKGMVTIRPEWIPYVTNRFGKEYGEQLQKMLEAQQKKAQLYVDTYKAKQGDIEVGPRGVYNKNTKQWEEKAVQTASVGNPFDTSAPKFDMNVEDVPGYRKVLETKDTAKIDDFLVSHGYLPATTPSTGGIGTNRKTTQEKEVETATEKKSAEIDLEAEKEFRTLYKNSRNNAHILINNSDIIYNAAANPETTKAFGVLSNANVKSAILGAIQEGIRVGSWSIGLAGIENAVRKAGGTQQEVDAALMLVRPMAENELIYTQMYMNKQGAITEGERAIVRSVGTSLSDTPKVAMAKAEMIKSRGQFDLMKSDLLHDWELDQKAKGVKHPLVKDFEESKEYKNLWVHYDDKTRELSQKYFPSAVKK